MKSLLTALGCVMVGAWIASGQVVSISLVFDQEQFLPGESVPLKVRIENNSGQDLRLGSDENWLTISVEDSAHLAVSRLGVLPVKGEFTLEPSTTGTKKVDIGPYFDLLRAGRYYVTAILNLPQWGQAIQSRPATFDVIRGSSLWDQEFGVPSSGKEPGSVPETRRYALVETVHSKNLKLYFRLTDPSENKVFSIFQLGPMVAFSKLESQLDKFSNLHVLYQAGGRTFSYCLINPDGLLLAREQYDYTDTRPTLYPEANGRITVKGGMRRVSASDLPPPAGPNAPVDATPHFP
jgi:hypothetical protein